MELLITFGVFGLVSGVIYFLFASRAPISDEVIQRRLESISPQAAPARQAQRRRALPDQGLRLDGLLQALRRGAGDSFNQSGQQLVRRNLNVQPTLTIRPGFPVRVIVNRDLVLESYKG